MQVVLSKNQARGGKGGGMVVSLRLGNISLTSVLFQGNRAILGGLFPLSPITFLFMAHRPMTPCLSSTGALAMTFPDEIFSVAENLQVHDVHFIENGVYASVGSPFLSPRSLSFSVSPFNDRVARRVTTHRILFLEVGVPSFCKDTGSP